LTRVRKRARSIYTKGEANRLIDSIIHPLLDQHPSLNLIDLILHGLVKQSLSETALKFIRYSLPKIIDENTSK
jgi:hypothetical protein